jgi:FkbH-like protein
MSNRTGKLTLAVTATFTAEPIRETLDFWMELLGVPSSVEFAPYHQVLQELLNPAGLIGSNTEGTNLILVRSEDWSRYDAEDAPADPNSSEDHTTEFLVALKAAAGRSTTPIIMCPCPEGAPDGEENSLRLEERLRLETASLGHVHVLSPKQVLETYPVETIFDPRADRLGHVPFTAAFFTALGTAVARKAYALLHPPYKVLALDCDNTLWKGVCGEGDVEIDPPRRALQAFALRKSGEGILVCLCSKNETGDVQGVFDRHAAEMPLSTAHIVSRKINWEPKSSNLGKMSEELNLGIDSFVFLDDNPLECAEVRSNCPGVLALQLPEAEAEIPAFLEHIWALENTGATAEDASRTELYRRNARREAARSEAPSYGDFINSLRLNVIIEPMRPDQRARVAQLTQRTNQFNASTIRRNESEVQALVDSGATCMVVRVSDRFGDYGLVGVVIFLEEGNALVADTFLLSCRTLGRGVECRMLAELVHIARDRHLDHVEIVYRKTEKNEPVSRWLKKTGILVPASLPPPAFVAEETEPARPTSAAQAGPRPAAPSETINRIALELREVPAIMAAMKKPVQSRGESADLVAPGNADEERLVALWCELLGVDNVGVTENFFELGGHSLLMVQVVARIAEETGAEVPMQVFFENPTVEGLAAAMTAGRKERMFDVIDLINGIDGFSDGEVMTIIERLEGEA